MIKMKPNKETLVILILVNAILACILIYFFLLVSKNSILHIGQNSSGVHLSVFSDSINTLNINSKAFIIYDPQARSVIAGKNEYFRFAPASSAKIMTATLVIENYPLDKVLTAEGVYSVDGSKMKLEEGEQITVKNLLYGLMLPSGNDAAYVLAQHYPGGIGAFINKMNEKAKSLAMDNTFFFDSDGYDDSNYTTAYDLARLGAFAMQNPTFAKIVSTKHIVVTDVSGKMVHNLSNLNELLGSNGVTGIKTGFTDEAGGVLVTSILSNKKTYIVVVLGSQDRFLDTESLIKNAVKRLHSVLY